MEGSSGILQRAAMWPALLWMAAVALKLRALSDRPGRKKKSPL
jgi:hypothetical protein